MVLQDSPPRSNSSILRQFNQIDLTHQHFSTFPHPHGSLPSIHSLGVAEESDMNNRRHFVSTNETSRTTHQGLSLSLGSPVLVPRNFINSSYLIPGEEEEAREVTCSQGMEHVSNNYSFMDCSFASSLNVQNRWCRAEVFSVGSSRYLKPTQSLLEEIVGVSGNTSELDNSGKLYSSGTSRKTSLELSSELRAEFCSNSGPLSTEKQEIQIKIAKLLALLEEVDVRSQKYYHQMEEVVSSLEVVAGSGAAKSYTILALQAMTCHFSSLREAIVAQINVAKRKFSQNMPKISRGLSRLRLFDQETRQHRTSLQQIGLLHSQRNAWRPIRGLPETSVTILRSWLFEHFLHPYPNDSEKLMLAAQTGLTKNQVSNWFINARVRLWKPMIEEMYEEEFGDSSEDSNPILVSSSISKEGTSTADHDEE